MPSVVSKACMAAAVVLASAGPLFAQEGAPQSESWGDVIRSVDIGKLAVILIFGTGFVAAAGYAVAGIVRAFNGSPDDSEQLNARLDELEARLEKLETRSSTPPATG